MFYIKIKFIFPIVDVIKCGLSDTKINTFLIELSTK